MIHERTILIADDQKHMLMLLEATVAPIGCRILTANCGEEVLIKAATTFVDLLLIDFEMSGLTGVQTVRKLKEDTLYANLPVILVTARGQNRVLADATSAGVTLVIPKPFSPMELLEIVRRLLIEPGTAMHPGPA